MPGDADDDAAEVYRLDWGRIVAAGTTRRSPRRCRSSTRPWVPLRLLGQEILDEGHEGGEVDAASDLEDPDPPEHPGYATRQTTG